MTALALLVLVSFLAGGAVDFVLWRILQIHARRVDGALDMIALWNDTTLQVQRNDSRIDIIVDMLVRNAKTEAVAKGLATMNSPMELTPEGRAIYKGMATELKEFYTKFGYRMTQNELFLEVQRRFGDRLFKDVCVPLGLLNNACIALAVEIAREAA